VVVLAAAEDVPVGARGAEERRGGGRVVERTPAPAGLEHEALDLRGERPLVVLGRDQPRADHEDLAQVLGQPLVDPEEPRGHRLVVALRRHAGGEAVLAAPGVDVLVREQVRDPSHAAGVVDQVALRARLERLMQVRLEGEDWTGLQELLKQHDLLPPPSSFAETLKKLKDEATKLSYETTKTIVLTRNLQAEFSELEGLIEGYLTDDAYKAFAEALREKKRESEAVEQAKKQPSPPATPAAPVQEPAAKKASPPPEQHSPANVP
ncbi:hypothetical protein HK102_011425, partial [Quaeritorhiza haematococci]